ncbi:hypothetical protein [Serratia marcescens]|nr:hypothetical protein [Serratia marcescens]
MDNKLSELSKPVAWLAIYHGDVYDEAISITRSVVEAQAECFGWESALTEITPLYSQEYVSALEKVAQYWIGQSYEWKQHAETVEKCIAGLESEITNVIGNHAKSATEHRVLLAKLGLLPDEIDDFALQVIGINKKNIYIPKPLFIPQEDIRVYLNADILITCLEKQGLILSYY